MDHLIKCARCGAPLVEVPERSVVQTVCAQCHFKYQVINGTLANKSSRQITLQRHSTRHGGSYKRDYELRLEVGDRQLEIVRFRIDGHDDRLPARRGDKVLVVHSMRGRQLEELLYVWNLTTGDILKLAVPGDRANRSATAAGVLAAVVLFTIAAAIGRDQPLAYFIAAALSYFAWRWIHRQMAPTHQLSPELEEGRKATQSLLERKQACDVRLVAALKSLDENTAHRERLLALRRKMSDVGLDLYMPRLAAIDRALVTLDEQRTVDIALRDGYDRAVKIFEIELETGAAAEQLEGDIAPVLLTKLDELRALEERQADLTRELEANAELEQFLRERP